jgi:outer membrane lipoprotein
MQRALRFGFVLLTTLWLAGCATKPPFPDEVVQSASTVPPPHVLSEGGGPLPAGPLIWGGVIISTQNLKQDTELTVLSFPLDDDLRPKSEEPTLGRFLIVRQGFLDPVIYAAGRVVTVVGKVDRIETRKIDNVDYRYPVIEAQSLYLWPPKDKSIPVYFSIGVGVHGGF